MFYSKKNNDSFVVFHQEHIASCHVLRTTFNGELLLSLGTNIQDKYYSLYFIIIKIFYLLIEIR